jgi:hypothetical protein
MKARVATLVGIGLSVRQAAAFLGIAHTTIARAIDDDPAFQEEVEQARTRATLHPLVCILRESGRNWKAAAWLLEHLAKDFYDRTPLERARLRATDAMEERLVDQLKAQFLEKAKADGENGGQAGRSHRPARRRLRSRWLMGQD